uniref:Uncharacterized protein n=1 Tax=Oryza barthii TaxID=65489 RepID=A0A0D3HFK6_9ORYZ
MAGKEAGGGGAVVRAVGWRGRWGLHAGDLQWQTRRNDLVFNGYNHVSFLQVIFKAIQFSRLWSLLLKEDEGIEVIAKCKLLEKRMMELFSTFGWNFRRRIEA